MFFYTCLNNFAIIITNESKLTFILKKRSQFKKLCDKQHNIEKWTIFIYFRNRQQRRHVLLYENHIVFCKQSGSDYHFKFSLATTTLGMSSIIKVTNGGKINSFEEDDIKYKMPAKSAVLWKTTFFYFRMKKRRWNCGWQGRLISTLWRPRVKNKKRTLPRNSGILN